MDSLFHPCWFIENITVLFGDPLDDSYVSLPGGRICLGKSQGKMKNETLIKILTFCKTVP